MVGMHSHLLVVALLAPASTRDPSHYGFVDAFTSWADSPRDVTSFVPRGTSSAFVRSARPKRSASSGSLANPPTTTTPTVPVPVRALLLSYSANSDAGEGDGNGECNGDGDENADFYDFLASRAASVNEPKAPAGGGGEGEDRGSNRQRRRDRVRKFLANRMGGGGGGDSMVRPIRIDGDGRKRQQRQQDDYSGDALAAGDGDGDGSPSDLIDDPNDVARVDAAFFQFKTDVRAQLADQRRDDPNSVPPNAEEFLDRVIEEVREYDLRELREARADKAIREYEEECVRRMEEDLRARGIGVGSGGSDDPIVREILEEARGDEESKLAEAEDMRSFKEYERAMRERADTTADVVANAGGRGGDDDVDERALRIMEDLLARRSEEPGADDDEDAPEWDTDNLEDGIAEIRTALEAKGKGVKKRPETMKEWQMYRSIATRIAEKEGIIDVDEDYVASQLESWKEFQEKEEEMRRDAGLTKGARMPFPWVDRLEEDDENNAAAETKAPVDRRHPDEIRADYDRRALQVLSDLMGKTADPARREKLMAEIEDHKADLADLERKIEERGPMPIFEEAVEEELVGPVDVSDIFGQSSDLKEGALAPDTIPAKVVTNNYGPPPPETPLFSDSFEEDIDVDEELPVPLPPDSPFFSSSHEDKADRGAGVTPDIVEGDDDGDVKSLGSLEEQKFRSMTRRAGVRSQAGEEELKRQWEEYLKAEKAMRDKSGLSGGEDPSLRTSKIDYDIDDVLRDGGDVDAEKILASIGERPSKKRENKDGSAVSGTIEKASASLGAKSEDEDEGYQQFLEYEEEQMRRARADAMDKRDTTSPDDEERDGEVEDVIVYHKHATQWDKTSVTDQLYRSLSPEASLRDDPEAKEKDKEAFQEYLEKEQDMRKAVEDMDVPEVDVKGKISFANDEGTETEEFLDLDKVDDYVDSALGSIGPRPEVRKRKSADADYARDYSDTIAPKTVEDDDDDVNGDDVPDWVKQERLEETERRKDGRYNDDAMDVPYHDDADYEEKQRQAEEFEQKYSSASKEISIGDVLGRDYFGPDDEPNDFYSLDGGRGSSFSSFEKRKKTLLDYTELSVAEVNSLMEYKEAESATGVSRYMKKVRKPYREFGAIFRLEGLLVDVTGLQLEAWKKLAEAHGFETPTLEDVRLASAHRTAYAVQKIFYWTDDVVEVRAIAKTHHDALKDAFGIWMDEHGVTYAPPKGPKSFDLFGVGEPSEPAASPPESVVQDAEPEHDESTGSTVSVPQPTESEYIGMQFNAWKAAAEKYGFAVPTVDEMQIAMYVGPGEAVTRTFQWTNDPTTTEGAVCTYLDALRVATNKWAEQHGPDVISKLKRPKEETKTHGAHAHEDVSGNALSKDDVMEMQLFAWTTAAEKHGFESPSLEDVQLASWVSTNEAVERVYNWAEDAETVEKIASTYRDAMKRISSIYIQKKNLHVSPTSKDLAAAELSAPAAPTQDDIMRLQLDAWTETARKHDCSLPNIDEVQLATFGSAGEAISRVFKWANEEEKVQEIAATHREVLTELSRSFMQRFHQSTGYGETLDVAKSDDDVADEGEDIPFFELREGAVDWLKSLFDVEMPLAVVSHLHREQVDVILEQTGLAAFFPPDRRVSATNFYGSQSQEMLGAALRLERRPDHCAVFDTTPSSSLAAHEVAMQSVCMIGIYKNYDLLSADLTVKYFDQLQTQNLRGLFSDTRLDEPQTEIQDVQPNTPKVETKVRFWEEGDRD